MKPRTALHILIGLLVAIALVFFASNLVAGAGSSMAEMINAQRRTPVLWVVDVCAVGVVGGMWWYAVMLTQFQTFIGNQAKQHHEQLDEMIERTSELERVNDDYADRIDRLEAELARQFRDLTDQVMTLENAMDARRKVFEIETRRISEHAYRIFQVQIEANTRHVEAMNMALQFQRGELRRLRLDFRDLQQGLTPALAPRKRPANFVESSYEQLAIGPSASEPEPSDPDFDTGQYEMLAGLDSAADGAPGETEAQTAADRDPERVQPEDVEALPAYDSSQVSPEPASSAEWVTDYASKTDHNSGWKSQVERLFHESPATKPVSESNEPPSEAHPPPALRIVDSGEAGSVETEGAGKDRDREDSEPKRPTASEATA